jgi:hypothetical protein
MAQGYSMRLSQLVGANELFQLDPNLGRAPQPIRFTAGRALVYCHRQSASAPFPSNEYLQFLGIREPVSSRTSWRLMKWRAGSIFKSLIVHGGISVRACHSASIYAPPKVCRSIRFISRGRQLLEPYPRYRSYIAQCKAFESAFARLIDPGTQPGFA